MPELPEVETVVMGLRDLLLGHKIQKVETDWPASLRIDEHQIKANILDCKITGLQRIGKMILIHLASHNTLVIHLKLTGQLVYRQTTALNEVKLFGAGHPNKSLISALPDKTTRVIFNLDRKANLFFNDVRKFGWIKMLPTSSIHQADFISKLGPDALTITSKEFVQVLCKYRRSIKACLLDQTIVAGCGNIYADESLWLSRLHPQTPACNLNKDQLKMLHKQLQYVLKLSIKQGGSSSRNYVNALGAPGSYLDFVEVYQRTDQPCHRCHTPIKRIVVVNRGTHICSNCQRQ